MRILTVIKHLGPGGIQRAAQNYMRGYRQKGHGVAALCLVKEGSRAEALRAEEIPVFTGGSQETERREALREAVAWHPDLIHIHRAGVADPVMTPAVRGLRRRLPSTVPFLETNSFGKVDYSTRRDLVDIHLMKARWALWKWQQWSRHYENEAVGTVIPNSVDTARFYRALPNEQSEFRERHDIPADAVLFGRIGQPIRCKWSTVIFDAFANVAARTPDVHLVVVGLPQELQKQITELSQETGSRVTTIPFLHSDADLRACYSSMDVFLHASDIGESFGTVLAESMACETPVITLSTPSHDNSQLEVVGHGRGGLTVADTQHMVQAMNALRADPELRRELGRRGAEWVQANYTIHTVMDRLEKVVQLVKASDSRARLREALHEYPDLPTQVSRGDIDQLLQQVMGPTPPTRRLLMRLVHIPWLHRLRWQFKRL